MLHIRRMDWRGDLGWMSQLPRELYSQPAVYCKSHLEILLNDRLSETDHSTRWPWLMLMKTTMTLFAPSSSLSSRSDHILPKLPTWILVHCKTFWFTLKLHELCFIEGKTWTQTRRCWESVNRWVGNRSNSVKLCRSRLYVCWIWKQNLFARYSPGTTLYFLGFVIYHVSDPSLLEEGKLGEEFFKYTLRLNLQKSKLKHLDKSF